MGDNCGHEGVWTYKHAEKAFRIWGVLAKAAKRCNPLAYKDVYDKTGIYYHGEQSFPLGIIQKYCLDHDIPRLTSMVGLKGTKDKVPSHGYAGNLAKLKNDRRDVYDHANKNPGWTNPGLAKFQAMAKADKK